MLTEQQTWLQLKKEVELCPFEVFLCNVLRLFLFSKIISKETYSIMKFQIEQTVSEQNRLSLEQLKSSVFQVYTSKGEDCVKIRKQFRIDYCEQRASECQK